MLARIHPALIIYGLGLSLATLSLPSANAQLAPANVTSTPSDAIPSVSPAVSAPAIDPVVNLRANNNLMAQGTSTTQAVDLAPIRLPSRNRAFGNFEDFHTSVLYKMPSRMFLNASVENSLRLETNVFQTLHNNKADMVYRVLPNVTIGYAPTKTTRISANYFFFRDQYTHYNKLLSRNIHSVGFRADKDFQLGQKTTVTTSFGARELFLTNSVPLNDLLPSVSIVRRVRDRQIIYGSVLGQIRFQNVLKEFQEGDQFYTIGSIYRTPRWTFIADTTYITNFGRRALRGGPNNSVFVLTMEGGYKVHPRLPLVAFLRAEPIFNIGANQATGFAGFNFRLFGGLRMEVAKPAIFPVKLRDR